MGLFKMSNYMGLIPTLMTSAPVVAAEDHGGASGGLPQFDPTSWPSQIFWLALCFAVMYFVFSRSTLPRIGSALEARRAKIEGDMKAAEALSAEAETIKAQFELSLKQAATEASATVKQADEAAKAKLSSAVADFRSRFDAEIIKTEARLLDSSKTVLEDMNKIAAEVAAQAAEKIAGIPADHSQAESVVRSLSQKAKAA
jgi:F-type H+-transporting ATPase subunit b